MSTRLCLIATDAISFNVLYRGQLEFLRQEGLNLTLICGGSEEEVTRLRRREVGRVIDLGFVRRPSPWRDGIGMLRLTVHLLTNRYDMVVSTTPKAILLGSIASWLACHQVRIVFFQGRVYENTKGIFRWFYTALDRLAIALSTRAVFVSNSLLAAYEYEGLVEHGQGKVVGSGSVNGVDVDRFCASKYADAEIAELKHTLGIRSDQLVSLTVGRICRDKGLIELFQLADALSESGIVFVVVGSVEPENESDALALLSLPNVRYVPFTDEVQRYFTISDVHLFLSHREGFGNVALEAASCGVPTIAFDVIGVKDSVVDGISGIRVPSRDLNTIRKILEAIVLDRQAFRTRFNAAREWVVTCYSHQKVWRSFLNFYRVNKITK